MILDVEPLPYRIGFKAEELEGFIRINLTLYDRKTAILKNSNKEALLEEDYIDVKPSLHSLDQVKAQATKACLNLISRKHGQFTWLEHRDVVTIRIDEIIKSTILEEKLMQNRLLSKFHNEH